MTERESPPAPAPAREQPPGPRARPRVGLFVTCIVDLFRPRIGFAAVRLLEGAGCEVVVPPGQTCCGQPGYNSGDEGAARALARQVIERFEGCDYVVAPSGSCIGMLREYPELFEAGSEGGARWRARAEGLAGRAFELTSFLVDVLGREDLGQGARCPGRITYHDSCTGLRELGIREQPRRLLSALAELSLEEMQDTEVCCGFGGTFCVKYPEISERMVTNKVERIRETGAGLLAGGDLGCLLNIAGRLSRLGHPVRVFHVAELLAGMGDGPAIGEPAPAPGERP